MTPALPKRRMSISRKNSVLIRLECVNCSTIDVKLIGKIPEALEGIVHAMLENQFGYEQARRIILNDPNWTAPQKGSA